MFRGKAKGQDGGELLGKCGEGAFGQEELTFIFILKRPTGASCKTYSDTHPFVRRVRWSCLSPTNVWYKASNRARLEA